MKRRFRRDGLQAVGLAGATLLAEDGVIEIDDSKCPPQVVAELERLAANGAGGFYETEPVSEKKETKKGA